MDYYKRALELKEEIIAHRRYFHTNAEVGLDMPKARTYIIEKLKEYGLEPQICGHGVSALLGKKGKVILLRADMDALPMPEESGEAFACPTGTEAHTCGHDFHAAMLLIAAKMLKENENKLKGRIKFMFQPAEETLEGCKDMIAAGILENPPVDVALAYHVAAGQMPVGIYMYNNEDSMMFSVDGFKLSVHGKGGHGAYPQNVIDPIHIAAHIYLALQEVVAKECDPKDARALTIGQFCGGTAANIIPDTAILQGAIRTNKPETRELLVCRMKEVAEKIAAVYGGSVDIEMLSEIPSLVCNQELTNQFVAYMKEMDIPGMTEHPGISASASEDFALIAKKVPATFMYLSAGFSDERGAYGAHNPKVQFNEDVCPIGAACYAHCAMQWVNSDL